MTQREILRSVQGILRVVTGLLLLWQGTLFKETYHAVLAGQKEEYVLFLVALGIGINLYSLYSIGIK